MTEFKFGDKVRIVNGFYQGCEGILTDERVDNRDARIILEVEIAKIDAINGYRTQTIEVYTNQLIIIKKAEIK